MHVPMTGKDQPIVIGIVGGIGSGKSTVAGILGEAGCVVCDSDALARQALEQPDVKQQLARRLGDDVLGNDGSVDREAVSRKVFDDPELRTWLESIIHPMVEQQRGRIFDDAPVGARALVIDAPLLLEAGLGEECDVILYVDTPKNIRQQRVEINRKWPISKHSEREEAQLPLDRKRERSHHVLSNEGDITRLRETVHEMLGTILAPDDAG